MQRLALSFFAFLIFQGTSFTAWASQLEVTIDFARYHNHAEVTEILENLANAHEDLAKLYSIGKSYQGKDLWCMEITNRAKGPAEHKPGIYIDGNTHAGEVSGGETCLYTIHYLLSRYGHDSQVTHLVDNRVFYIVPKINPDGSDAYLRKPSDAIDPDLKKFDDDEDGAQDEDGPEDLNGDGLITVMRIRDTEGPYKTSPDDPRLMVKKEIDEEGEWRVVGPEGVDNDEDGEINEDPPGKRRTVSNRNYPAFWAPTWIQSGAGKFPLSEPEAKAQVEFLFSKPNIASAQSYHTHSGVILWGYCGRTEEHIPKADIENFKAIGKLGTDITGYPLLHVYRDFTSDPNAPRHGDFIDWVYDHYGAFGLCTEIWKAPGETGRSAFEEFDPKIALEWSDKEIGGEGFVPWTKYDHPEFGEVEIGGWNYNYLIQNPPAKMMEEEWKKNCLFELKRAELVPALNIKDVNAEDLGDKLFRITAKVANTGYLPTNVTEKAIENGLAKPVEAKLELEGAELLCGDERTELGHIKGNYQALSGRDSSFHATEAENDRTVTWLVRVKAEDASVTVTFQSQKAGTVSESLTLRR
jgi:murein tripeptide amidase MpaA